uniref:Cytochrome c oxidase subunit 3 n=1 Tax=Syrbatus sp. 3 RRMO-2024a TaxID=3154169 RepID=A0AAU7LKT0_9COLE
MLKNNPFHMINYSPWPFMLAFNLLFIFMSFIKLFYHKNFLSMTFNIMVTFMIMFQWWRDIIRESTFLGNHTSFILKNLKWSMMIFITSELLFFISIFWSFFHSSLSPSIEIGMNWPPLNIIPLNPLQLPLLNTLILLSSSMFITKAHYSINMNNYKKSLLNLFFTILLGIMFSILQLFEYYSLSFSISDSIYSSLFFFSTGFHGFHVIIGTMFLFICLLRQLFNHFSNNHFFAFESASWYWHFVDLIWLFIYTFLYWWGKLFN